MEYKFTGNRDTDLLVFLDLDDCSLAFLSSTGQCFYFLLRERRLWQRKLQEYLGLPLPLDYCDHRQIYQDSKRFEQRYKGHHRGLEFPFSIYNLGQLAFDIVRRLMTLETLNFYLSLHKSQANDEEYQNLANSLLLASLNYGLRGRSFSRLSLSLDAKVETWHLLGAVSRDDYEFLRLLLEHAGPEIIDDEHSSPLIYATELNSPRLVQLLLVYGADPNIHKGEPLIVAAHFGHYDVAKILLDFGADANIENGSPLETAVFEDQYQMSKLLLEKKAEQGRAVEYCHNEEIMKLLLEYDVIRCT